jgi:primosomal protein N' (replication factor Y)
MPKYAQVVFNHPLRDRFTYRIPEDWQSPPPIGARVRASFARRPGQIGFVLGHSDTCDFDERKVLPLDDCLDSDPVFTPELLKLIDWVSEYYFCSEGEALFAAFPYGGRTEVRLPQLLRRGPNYQAAFDLPRFSAQRRKVLECFEDPEIAFEPKELRDLAGVGQSVLKALADVGALEYTDKPGRGSVSAAEDFYRTPPPALNPDQESAVDAIKKRLREGGYEMFLLHGVTGSGKTEVFLQAIEETLAHAKTALVLVPEIALTPQTAARYRGRFPGRVEVLHSGLSQARRFDAWRRVRAGEIPVVVGTRSAVFAPLPNLGLLVVDEEHDSSYKQADPAPRYHARDVATYRGLLCEAAVVLGSATPSLESYENVSRKKGTLLKLPDRATAHPLPEVRMVDMRYRAPSERILSQEAKTAIGETLAMGLQSILFLNRRGHSTQLACRECGHAMECQNCSVTLVWHESDRTLRCHHCAYRQPEPEVCPSCGSVWIRARGYGTQQVAQTVTEIFPKARVERIDLDTTREEGAHDRILSALRKGEIDILVGTQMVSKGLDMPGVRLVVVVQAETSLNIADFRAAERSFALLTQVAGRAGRGAEPGTVLVQSYQPQHYSIRMALKHDYLAFRSHERRFRGQLGLPPHTRLLNCRVEGPDEEKVRNHIQGLVEQFAPRVEKDRGARLIGPTPCPLERIQNRYRWQFLVVTRDALERKSLLEYPEINKALIKQPSKLRVIVDVDPVNLL